MILIALGANLSAQNGQSPLATCRAAAEALAGLPGLRPAGVSRWYRTAAIPADGAPDYVNGIVRLEGAIDPVALLARLQRIEAQAGRVRNGANAPRTLDLDIVAIDALVRDHPDPVLPHPRAHEREFVLRPLRDVAPGWVHPRLETTVEALLAALPPQGVMLL